MKFSNFSNENSVQYIKTIYNFNKTDHHENNGVGNNGNGNVGSHGNEINNTIKL